MLTKILAAYGIHGAQFFGIEKGYRNSSHHIVTTTGRHLNLIIYKREPDILARIQRTNAVGDALAAQNFPARKTYDRRILRMQAGQIIRYSALYHYLPGTTIAWEAYTMRHIKQLGKALGDMHATLQTVPTAGVPAVTDEYIAITGRMQRYFANPDVQRAMAQKLHITISQGVPAGQTRLLQHCVALPGQQLLHMDFVRGNILFKIHANTDGLRSIELPSITGVLDFEKVAIGHPLFDIARTYAFLLVDCKYKQPDKIRKYLLQSGYNKYSQSSFTITSTAEKLLEQLTGLFLLYDFYKFLHHNPYEHLHKNEHYIRTKQILINRNIIRTL
jgi:Ser/Thr protein kinase RdoA (MazF antagonist)